MDAGGGWGQAAQAVCRTDAVLSLGLGVRLGGLVSRLSGLCDHLVAVAGRAWSVNIVDIILDGPFYQKSFRPVAICV